VSGSVVRCDGCGEPGHRRAEHCAPDFWFFIESEDRTPGWPGGVYIVYACSESCRDKLWHRGSGPGVIDEEGSQRERAKPYSPGSTWSALNFAKTVLEHELRDERALPGYRARCEKSIAVLERMLGGGS